MNLMEYLESAAPDSIIYLAAKESSCFIMIGTPETLMQDFDAINNRIWNHVKALEAKLKITPDSIVPLEDREVVDTYYRTTDLPGVVVTITGKTYVKGFWFKHEYDESLGRDSPRPPAQKKPMSDSGYDKLRGAIVKQAVVDYMNTSEKSVHPNCNHAEMKDFFSGKWFDALCGFDGKWMLKMLKEEKEKKGDKKWRFDE